MRLEASGVMLIPAEPGGEQAFERGLDPQSNALLSRHLTKLTFPYPAQ